jgi:hypothetical protein
MIMRNQKTSGDVVRLDDISKIMRRCLCKLLLLCRLRGMSGVNGCGFCGRENKTLRDCVRAMSRTGPPVPQGRGVCVRIESAPHAGLVNKALAPHPECVNKTSAPHPKLCNKALKWT